MNYDFIIVGSGYAGSICARTLAEQNKSVLIIERKARDSRAKEHGSVICVCLFSKLSRDNR
jgi:choline dehydrogenase-like flavoprotein